MILISVLEVRNLKNIVKLTIKIITAILIVILMKAITTIKVAMKIKLIAVCRHQPQKELFPYLETVW